MLCVNIIVGKRFDFVSIRMNQLVIGLIIMYQFVNRQRTKIMIGFAVTLSFTVEESVDLALLAD